MDTLDTIKIKDQLRRLDTQLGILERTSGNDAASRSVRQLTPRKLSFRTHIGSGC